MPIQASSRKLNGSSTMSGGLDTETDVLIVGGGVTGLTLTLESSRLCLSTAVIEGDDFGAGASANSLRHCAWWS
jgi:glycerol-3-phosphate dehydrogenase